jgi:hypothetical protein
VRVADAYRFLLPLTNRSWYQSIDDRGGEKVPKMKFFVRNLKDFVIILRILLLLYKDNRRLKEKEARSVVNLGSGEIRYVIFMI